MLYVVLMLKLRFGSVTLMLRLFRPDMSTAGNRTTQAKLSVQLTKSLRFINSSLKLVYRRSNINAMPQNVFRRDAMC
jgi:hypothetical protein